MRLDKVIVKAALSTLGAVLALLVILLAALSLIFPQTMMEFTYSVGMEGASIHFAKCSYDRSGDVYYIAYAFETAVGAGDYANVDACGERLIADEDEFVSYCDARTQILPEGATGTYQEYVYRQVCTAKYRCGNAQGAIERALQLCGEKRFARNNALVAVIVAAMGQKDGQTINGAIAAMQSINAAELSAEDSEYLGQVVSAAMEWADKNS